MKVNWFKISYIFIYICIDNELKMNFSCILKNLGKKKNDCIIFIKITSLKIIVIKILKLEE